MQKISKRKIQQCLAESVFDPRKPSHLSPIIENVSPRYSIARCRELLYNLDTHPNAEKIRDVISLLAYAKVQLERV